MNNLKKPRLDHVPTPRVVKLLGGNARLAENDEDAPVFEEPLRDGAGPAFSEGDLTPGDVDAIVADLQFNQHKSERFHRDNDRQAMRLQVQENARRGELL